MQYIDFELIVAFKTVCWYRNYGTVVMQFSDFIDFMTF